MASVNSQAELFPNRAFTPTGSDDFPMDDDPEFQARMPLRTRHRSSYENMNGRTFTDDAAHQYEDPARLKEEVFHSSNRGRPLPEPSKPSNKKAPRRKVNETYEPVQSKQRRRRTLTDESESSDGYHKDRCSVLFKILAFVGFFFSLAALAVIVMFMLGILTTPTCRDCKKEVVPGYAGPQASGSGLSQQSQELWQVIDELKANVSRLSVALRRKDEVISQLQKRDLEHTGKIEELEKKAIYRVFVSNNTEFNVSRLVGPRGPPGISGSAGPRGEDGLDGKPGKTGPGNMTLCRYKSRESVSFTAASYGNGQNVIVAEPQGHRIVSVTCSTFGTSEYNLKSEINSQNVRRYECECRGVSSVFGAGNGHALCVMHYWICPLIS